MGLTEYSLCIFCIRKRRQAVPTAARPVPKAKKPALRRAEARERLLEVTEISTVGTSSHSGGDGGSVKPEVETRSVLEREWYFPSYSHFLISYLLTNLQRNMSINPVRACTSRTRKTQPRYSYNGRSCPSCLDTRPHHSLIRSGG